MVFLWDVSQTVAKTAAPDFAQSLEISIDPDNLGFVLFLSILFFVAAHEFTHHDHGHFRDDPLAFMWRGMLSSSSGNESLEIQATEIDADSHAVFLVLQNLLKGAARPLALPLLSLETLPEHVQDNALFSCFALAVVSYFLATTPVVVNVLNAYTLEHPPQAKRIDNLMKEAQRWSSTACPELAVWINPKQFDVLISIAVRAVFKEHDLQGWEAQKEFLTSDEGQAYLRQLATARDALLTALARRASSVTS